MIYITYCNYKGGINNLIVATDSKTGLTATSTKSKEAAIVRLDRKIAQHQQAQKTQTSQAAVNRYNKKTYVQFAARIKPDLSQRIEDYTKREGISKPQFLERAINTLEK